MLTEYSGIPIIIVWAIVFPALILGASKLFHPKNPTPVKLQTYECGLETQGDTWVQFKISYFMYALVFVAFDVETVFLYPWAIKFQSLGLFAIVEMFVFIAILLVGFWYAWKEGALEWM
ncbi:NADH-quinone oxidoreductase subunit A [Phosphitispora fastidiosa]|uniref:NADH-quinone oxidoreductase subunit A n=1 Tax=Phosphitispora fastidiosa TaxID=2837202 RepID=UPI001E522EFF|nr:NADH-quinone oxidoreductase subunit A [Phosphitispora fastidiosa]MBU7005449.1 NADH-quinone oxidoreductase subunit A [Phosphitispora fastidiosa]